MVEGQKFDWFKYCNVKGKKMQIFWKKFQRSMSSPFYHIYALLVLEAAKRACTAKSWCLSVKKQCYHKLRDSFMLCEIVPRFHHAIQANDWNYHRENEPKQSWDPMFCSGRGIKSRNRSDLRMVNFLQICASTHFFIIRKYRHKNFSKT